MDDVSKSIDINQSYFLLEKDKVRNSKIRNSWRSIMYNKKGKKAGCCEEWLSYNKFFEDMFPTWKEGNIIQRIEKDKPFSKDNCFWTERCNQAQSKLLKLEHNGEIKTIKEWSIITGMSYMGIRLRYFHTKKLGKELNSQEIIYGKNHFRNREVKSAKDLSFQKVKDKASKMVSSYKIKDKRKGFITDINTEWMIENILYESCSYCGTKERVGCDRKDNLKGHTKDNCVPCCIVCNTVRNSFFTVEEMKKIGSFLKTEIFSKR